MAETTLPSWPRTALLLASRRWWWVTLIVLAGIGLLVRLGIWQLDRLTWRRALNADIVAQLEAEPLVLSAETSAAELAGINYRPVLARGHFDLAGQFVLLQQNYNGQAGVYLFAPLLLAGDDRAILVNRGWLPAGHEAPESWTAYDQTELLEITGFLQQSRKPPRAALADYDNSIAAPERQWFWPYIAAIQQQYPYELLPAFIQIEPSGEDLAALPYPVASEVDLSEGNHLSYAYQWFAFALILAVVYIYLVRRQEGSLA